MPEESIEPELVYKYVSFDAGEAIINSNSLKFTSPQKFNDPFDCDLDGLYFDLTGEVDDRVKKDLEILKPEIEKSNMPPNRFHEGYESSVRSKKERSVVACFSQDENNTLMWSHYANNYNGMCLTFDNKINDTDRFIDLKISLAGVMNYDLVDKINYCSNKILGMQKLFLSKSSHWKYENEYRLISLNDEGFYKYNPLYLTEIKFGLRVLDEDIFRIMRMCKRRNFSHLNFFKSINKDGSVVYETINF